MVEQDFGGRGARKDVLFDGSEISDLEMLFSFGRVWLSGSVLPLSQSFPGGRWAGSGGDLAISPISQTSGGM